MAKPLLCPLLQKACIENKCAWFMKLSGTNKNTGEQIDDWGCAVSWLPVMLVEVANETRQGAAATESLRNASVRGEDATRMALMNGLANAALRLGDGNGT